MAGPITNLFLGIIFFAIFITFAFFSILFKPSSFIGSAAALVAIINFFIGSFNMIPVMPFDGAKIFKWSKIIYFLMLALLLPPTFIFLFGIII